MDLRSLPALDILQHIESQCRQRVLSTPGEMVDRGMWAGIGFRIAGIRVVASMNEVSEIFNLPAGLTRVPGSSPWVRGIANIRGSLLPIMDLQAFLGGKQVLAGRRSRVLVIHRDDLFTGLLVGDVLGMKHFSPAQRLDSLRVDSMIGRLVSGAFRKSEGSWPVISIEKLINDELFRKAAA